MSSLRIEAILEAIHLLGIIYHIKGYNLNLNFLKKYRDEFIHDIKSYSESGLDEIRIERTEVGQSKTLGSYLMRIAYHESVHTGQILDYLRTAEVDRPQVWD
jgi:uncharacterized damage-inducible protein DinB